MSSTQPGSGQAYDFYEVLQVNPNAEPDTIQRVYRLMARRYHPDNQKTGDDTRFQALQEAYRTLSDPTLRAEYDIRYQEIRRSKWRAASAEIGVEDEFELEEVTRLTVLEVLYAQRRTEPHAPGIFVLDFEDLTG